LDDPDWKIRKSAIESLGNSPGARSKSISALAKKLNDHEPEVVRAAIVSLGRIGRGSSQAEEAVSQFAGDHDTATNECAIVALMNIKSNIDDASVPILMKSLGSDDEHLFMLAGATIAGADAPTFQRLVPPLMQNLESDRESQVSRTLILLGHLQKHSALLSDALLTQYDKVRSQAHPQMLQVLSSLDPKAERSNAILLKALNDASPATRKQAIVSLAKAGRDQSVLLPILASALKDPDLDVRVQAFKVIRSYGDGMSAAYPLVTSGLQDEDPNIRVAALEALPSFKKSSRNMIEILEQVAEKDKDPGVRTAAFATLSDTGAIHTPDLIPFLEKSLATEVDSNVKTFLSDTVTILRRRMALEKGGMIPGEQLGR